MSELEDWARRDLEANVKAMRDAFPAVQELLGVMQAQTTYPPEVQEAIRLVEQETHAQKVQERQANCAHRDPRVIDEGTYEEPGLRLRVCWDCGLSEEFNAGDAVIEGEIQFRQDPAS